MFLIVGKQDGTLENNPNKGNNDNNNNHNKNSNNNNIYFFTTSVCKYRLRNNHRIPWYGTFTFTFINFADLCRLSNTKLALMGKITED